jgi:DNA-binding NtrC family response regulator
VIAATHRDLEARVASGDFRADLFYRLHVVPIAVPPLRERAEDVPLLAEHFLAVAAERTGLARKRIARRALGRLMEHPWPGNVRQLEHAITNAVVLADGDELNVDDFAALWASGAARETDAAAAGPRRDAPLDPDSRRQRERDRIVAALEACGWNKSKAARMLEIPRRTFYRRLDEYGIR